MSSERSEFHVVKCVREKSFHAGLQLAAVVFLICSMLAGTVRAQNKWIRNCLPFQVEAHLYKKSNYNKKGELQTYQKISIDSIKETGNTYKFTVRFYTYNPKGKLLDSTKTTSTIDPDHRTLLVNLLPFSDYAEGSEIKVNAKDTCISYPKNPQRGQNIPSIEVGMNIKKGVIGFLNGKSKIRIYHRRVVKNDTLRKGRYELNTDVSLGVYVFGIRMRSMDYHVTEIVDERRGIVYQRFNREEGGHFSVRLLSY